MATPRLQPYTPERGLEPAQRELYNKIIDDRGKTGARAGFGVTNEDGSLVGPWNAWAASPVIGAHFERLGYHCRHNSACAPDLYEVGILAVAASWKCQFEWYAHEKLALKAGISPEAIESIRTLTPPAAAAGLTDAQRAVYAYSVELVETKRASDATHVAAAAAVGGERAMIDFVMTMGLYSSIAMQLNAFAVPLPEGEAVPFAEPEDATA